MTIQLHEKPGEVKLKEKATIHVLKRPKSSLVKNPSTGLPAVLPRDLFFPENQPKNKIFFFLMRSD